MGFATGEGQTSRRGNQWHRGLVTAFALALTIAVSAASGALAAPAPGVPATVAPGVPDQGRAWELVTAPDTDSTQVFNVRAITAAGDRLSYMTKGPLPGAPAGAPMPTANLAVRGAGGWTSVPLAVPFPYLGSYPTAFDLTIGAYIGGQDFSPDLGTVVGMRSLPPGGVGSDRGLFRWGTDGAYSLLADIGPLGALTGVSDDAQHVVFASERHLLPADAGRSEGQSLYEVAGSTLRLVDVAADGSPLSPCGATVPNRKWNGEQLFSDRRDTISRDGRRIFFQARPGCAGPTRVFMREDGATTTEVSASQCTLADCGPAADVSFAAATPDGSRVFLVSAEKLTDDDGNAHADLYRYDVAGHDLTLLTDVGGGPELVASAAQTQVSSDGSRVYFLARQWDGTEATGQPAYHVADGAGVRRLPGGEASDLALPILELSADGRYAVLETAESAVPGDDDPTMYGGDGNPIRFANDVYRYDAETGSVVQISTGPTASNRPVEAWASPNFISETASTHPFSAMSEDGSRIFFSTEERLLPEDRNEVNDVYEWANGSLGLISSGSGDHPAMYLGSTPDGRTVFFRTTQTLLRSDRDGGDLDFYAARIGGGFAEPLAAAVCEGAACSGPRQRASRSAPRTAGSGAGIELRRPDAAARRRAAASGWIELLAEVPAPGRLTAAAFAKVGGKAKTIAAAAVKAAQAGPVQLRMRLSRPARRQLARGEGLRVRVTLRLSQLRQGREIRFELGGAR